MCLCQRAMLSGIRSFSSSSVASGLVVYITPSSLYSCIGSAVEQSCWLARVEMEVSLSGIGVVDEVVLGLLDFRIRNDISVEQSLAVVLVALDSCLHVGYNGLCFLLVAGLLGPQRGHVHVAVAGHGHHTGAHAAHVLVVVHVHSGHAAVLLALLPCVPRRRGQQRGSKDERQHHGALERERKRPILFFVHCREPRYLRCCSRSSTNNTATFAGFKTKCG